MFATLLSIAFSLGFTNWKAVEPAPWDNEAGGEDGETYLWSLGTKGAVIKEAKIYQSFDRYYLSLLSHDNEAVLVNDLGEVSGTFKNGALKILGEIDRVFE